MFLLPAFPCSDPDWIFRSTNGLLYFSFSGRGAESSAVTRADSHGDLAAKHDEGHKEKQLSVVPYVGPQNSVVENGKGGLEDDSCHENGSLHAESVQVTVIAPAQGEEERHIG